MLFVVAIVAALAVTLTDAEEPCKTPCNAGIDHVLSETNADIEKRSPLERRNKEYCDVLTFWGAYTMVRSGDVCTNPIPNSDCFEQQFKVEIQNLTFKCLVNMEMLTKAMEEYTNDPSKAMENVNNKMGSLGGRKRRFSLTDVEEPEAYVVGHWLKVCIGGKMKICKSDPSKSDVSNMGLCSLEIDNCELTCEGDPKLQSLCSQDQFIGKFKQVMGSLVQVVAQGEIKNSIVNGPSDICHKFNCEYASKLA